MSMIKLSLRLTTTSLNEIPIILFTCIHRPKSFLVLNPSIVGFMVKITHVNKILLQKILKTYLYPSKKHTDHLLQRHLVV